MKKAKVKPKKKQTIQSETDNTMRNGIIIGISVAAIFVFFYLITTLLIDDSPTILRPDPPQETTFISFNRLLDQEPKEYYVLARFENDSNERVYEKYFVELGVNIGTGIRLFQIDMSDTFSKAHIGEETNIAETIRDLTISDTGLFLIKEGKIDSHHIGSEQIIEYLKQRLRESVKE